MSDVAIRVESLSKRYRRGLPSGNDRLTEVISNLGRGLLQVARRRWSRSPQPAAAVVPERSGEFWALQDVSFEVKHGEAVGIIGRNGAGKSTLLKILSRITEPTAGRFGIAGRVGSLLEVGTGFHPDLTGRENVFLNGTFLGMSRREIARKFDAIAAFAEIDAFLDTPVKWYSSGMHVRLGFAVAAHLEPDILIVDEALAVGDAAFQKKCLEKMQGMAKSGRAVVLVSHSQGTVASLCSRAVWLHEGRVREAGKADDVVESYLAFLEGVSPGTEKDFQLGQVILKNGAGEPAHEFVPGETLTVELHYHALRPIARPLFWVALAGKHGQLFGAHMGLDGHGPDLIDGPGVIACSFPSLPLVPRQTYTVRVGVGAEDGHTWLVPGREVAQLRVVGSMNALGFSGAQADGLVENSPSLILPYQWRLPNGRTIAVDGFGRKS